MRLAMAVAGALATLVGCGAESADDQDGSGAGAGSAGVSGSSGAGATAGSSGTVTGGAAGSSGSGSGGSAGTSPGDSGPPDATDGSVSGSRCQETPTEVSCEKQTLPIGSPAREVHFQVPLGTAPPAGFKAALMFQGSLFSAEMTWAANLGMPFGAYHQTLVVKRLLDAGFAVITPETKGNGGTYWDTNIPPHSQNWEGSDDHALMLEIFAAIDAGRFGPIDGDTLYATGISSGGYMTSRVAIAYPGRFSSIAVAAGSYASCAGPICNVPDLDPSHPPTLLLHGRNDLTVPLSTAERYHQKLTEAGIETRLVIADGVGHAWIPAAPDEVVAWFELHP